MAINLEKGQRINLEKAGGERLRRFCVGCNWGAISEIQKGFLGLVNKKVDRPIDLDLSCAVFDDRGQMLDHIYSPEYRHDFLERNGMPPGKLRTADGALRHSGDDRKGDTEGDDGLDNEIISIDLDRINPDAAQVFFFLNNVGKEDFSQIPYASIRMYEGTPQKVDEVFAAYDVASEPAFAGKRALILGKLYKRGNEWRFSAIGDATNDAHLCDTIRRISADYAK